MHHSEVLYDLAQMLPFHDVYLELGVQFASTFRLVGDLFTRKIAVDINPCPVPPEAEFHQISTREFFDTRARVLCDLIFIDADHHHAESWHDAMRALEWIKPITGLVVLHDTYPDNAYELDQMRSGDSWRTAMGLRGLADLEVLTLPGMHGLTVVRWVPNGQHLHWASNDDLHAQSV